MTFIETLSQTNSATVLLDSFHLNAHTRVSSTDSKVTTTFIDSRFGSGSERVN